MKKFISLFLCALIVLCSLPVSVLAGEEELCLDIVTDAHYSYSGSVTPITKSTDEDPFGHVSGNGKLFSESAAIFAKFLENAMTDESDFIIFTGDITDDGSLENELAVKNLLEEFEAKSGKTVLCMPGNHETYNSSAYSELINGYAVQFKEVYANLGYDKAVAVDDDTASYTADLSGNYRIIFIDTNNFNDELLSWIEAQVAEAKADGKVLISATHFNLFSHYTFEKLISWTVVDSSYGVADKFIEWGIRFNLSGHTHELDIASYSNDNGTVYDIVSGSLTTYPACYRTMKFSGNSVDIDTEYIKSVDYSLVPTGLCAEAENLLKTDVNAYAKAAFLAGSAKQMNSLMNAGYLCSVLGINTSENPEIVEILSQAIPRVKEAMNLPLYGEEGSLSALGTKYGYTIPESDYDTAVDVFCEAYAQHCAGNENSASYSNFGKLAINSLGACFSYGLDTLTSEQYNTLINFLLTKVDLGIDIPDSVKEATSNQLTKSQSVRFLIQYVATPLIDDFLHDQSVDDVSLTLANYGTSQETESFSAKLRSLFNKLLSYLNMLFSFISEVFIRK